MPPAHYRPTLAHKPHTPLCTHARAPIQHQRLLPYAPPTLTVLLPPAVLPSVFFLAEFAEKRKTYSFFLLTDDLAVANSSGGPKTLMYRVK